MIDPGAKVPSKMPEALEAGVPREYWTKELEHKSAPTRHYLLAHSNEGDDEPNCSDG